MYIATFKCGQNLCISLIASEALDDVDGAATGLRHRSRIMTCIILWYDSNSDVWRCPYVMYILKLMFFVCLSHAILKSKSRRHARLVWAKSCLPATRGFCGVAVECLWEACRLFFVNKNVFAAMIHCLHVTYFADIQYDVNICCTRSAAYERFQYISAFCI